MVFEPKADSQSVIMLSIRNNMRQYVMAAAMIIIWLVFHFATDRFLTPRNLSNLFLQSAAVATLAIGMVLIIVTNNIDLSVGSFVGFIGAVVAALQVKYQWDPLGVVLRGVGIDIGPDYTIAISAIIAGIIIGMMIGAWHGFWIAYRGVPAFIVTLASMMILRGGILYFTADSSISNMKPMFKAIGNSYLPNRTPIFYITCLVACLVYVALVLRRRAIRKRYGFHVSSISWEFVKLAVGLTVIGGFFYVMNEHKGIPYAWLIVLAIMLVFTFITEKTTFGRHLYAIGGNIDAARLSGINIRLKQFYMFVLMGAVSSIAGIIFLARINSATAQGGNGLELDAIASAVVGGTSLLGGEGSISGAVVGALIMTSLDNGMSMMNIDVTWQYIVKGIVLLLAVWLDMATRRRN